MSERSRNSRTPRAKYGLPFAADPSATVSPDITGPTINVSGALPAAGSFAGDEWNVVTPGVSHVVYKWLLTPPAYTAYSWQEIARA